MNYITITKLLRPKQWVKNGFVLVGYLFSGRWTELNVIIDTIIAFSSFCLIASSIYIINDIVDREHDKLHPQKRFRPIVSEEISIKGAIKLFVILLACGLGISWLSTHNISLFIILVLYVSINIAYSCHLKKIVILDVFIIAGGFVLRIFAGTIGIGVYASEWLVMCTLMISLLLGFGKRRSELVMIKDGSINQRKVMGFYNVSLLDQMMTIVAAGTIITYCLYTIDDRTVSLYGNTNMIYSIPFVLYGVLRYFYLVHVFDRGQRVVEEVLTDSHIIISVLLWIFSTLMVVYR